MGLLSVCTHTDSVPEGACYGFVDTDSEPAGAYNGFVRTQIQYQQVPGMAL